MGITSNFNRDEMQKRMDAFLDVAFKRTVETLQRLGEKCVEEARLNKGYEMQTGALISSTGYKVFVDGIALHESFEAIQGNNVKTGDEATKGVIIGQDLADKIGSKTDGFALVVVAGMNYATYVEAKGYNVLASAENLAKRELPRMLNALIEDFNKSV